MTQYRASAEQEVEEALTVDQPRAKRLTDSVKKISNVYNEALEELEPVADSFKKRIDALAASFESSGEDMKTSFTTAYASALGIKKTSYDVVGIPGAAKAFGEGFNVYWRFYLKQTLAVIDEVETIGADLT